MNRDACREFRGDLAVRALGHAEAEPHAALDAHLDGCAECRDELEDLRDVAGAVRLADIDHVTDRAEAPSGLPARILDVVGASVAAQRRRRRLLTGASTIVAAAAVVLAVLVFDGESSSGRRIEFGAGGEATGSAELVSRSWGTEVSLEVSGLDAGEVYWLWLTGEDGKRVVAGTLIGTGGSVKAVLASAISTADARRIWMTDEDDAIVLDAPITET
ncbi:MAG: hypothetical protein AB7Q42_07380 [Acidimicrobiia bacterium]